MFREAVVAVAAYCSWGTRASCVFGPKQKGKNSSVVDG